MYFQKKKINLMGTKIEIKLYTSEETLTKKLIVHAVNLLNTFNDRLSFHNPNSEISLINNNSGIKPTKVKKDLFYLIKECKEHSLDINSNLNIAIGPLVKLWNIGFENANVPNKKDIEKTLNLIDPNNIELCEENLTIFLNKKGMQIDLGAVAKGFIADKVMQSLIKNGVTSAYINLGGNILTYGNNFKTNYSNWRIGLQNPLLPRGKHMMLLSINNKSIVTSGIYERKLEQNGKIYHHIFDSKTGYPIESEMKSLSIISNKSLDCDIWSSKLFGSNIDNVLDFANNNNLIDVIIINKENNLYYSKGIEEFILWKENR